MKKKQRLPQNELASLNSCPYKGHIHTVQIDLYQHELSNLRKIDAKAVPYCVKCDTYRGEGATIRSLHYNPNTIALRWASDAYVDPLNEFPHKLGDCNTLADFNASMEYWAKKTNVPMKCAHIVRVDFAFDIGCEGLTEAQNAEQISVFRAIVAAFALKHGAYEKNQYEGKTIYTGRWKNIKALHGTLSIEAYDRRIKDPDSPVALRLEIRYGEKMSNRTSPSNTPTVSKILQIFEAEFYSLRSMLQRVEKAYNNALIDKWGETLSGRHLDFVRANEFYIFTRRQLSALIWEIGDKQERKQAYQSAGDQLKNHKSIYHAFKPKRYTEAIDACIEALRKYRRDSTNFEKQFEIAESADPFAAGLLKRFTY